MAKKKEIPALSEASQRFCDRNEITAAHFHGKVIPARVTQLCVRSVEELYGAVLVCRASITLSVDGALTEFTNRAQKAVEKERGVLQVYCSLRSINGDVEIKAPHGIAKLPDRMNIEAKAIEFQARYRHEDDVVILGSGSELKARYVSGGTLTLGQNAKIVANDANITMYTLCSGSSVLLNKQASYGEVKVIKSIGDNVTITARKLTQAGQLIKIGSNCIIDCARIHIDGDVEPGGGVELGENVSLTGDSIWLSAKRIPDSLSITADYTVRIQTDGSIKASLIPAKCNNLSIRAAAVEPFSVYCSSNCEIAGVGLLPEGMRIKAQNIRLNEVAAMQGKSSFVCYEFYAPSLQNIDEGVNIFARKELFVPSCTYSKYPLVAKESISIGICDGSFLTKTLEMGNMQARGHSRSANRYALCVFKTKDGFVTATEYDGSIIWRANDILQDALRGVKDKTLLYVIEKDGLLSLITNRKRITIDGRSLELEVGYRLYDDMISVEEKEHFIISEGSFFAHGETITEAYEDFVEKECLNSPQMFDKYKGHHNAVIPVKEAVLMYRAVTGSCRLGVQRFIEEHNITAEKISIAEILVLTENAYRGEKFKEFIGENKDVSN